MSRSRLEPGSFLGQTVGSLRSSQLHLVESRYGPRFCSKTHSHEQAFCCLILEGSCTQTYGTRSRACVKSNLAFHPIGEPHSDNWHATGGRCLHLEFDARWVERVREYSLVLDQPVEFNSGPPVWLAARIYQELRTSDATSSLAIEALALELATKFARKSTAETGSRPPMWLARVVELVESCFREPLTLDDMAHEAGVHPVHLVTVFRRHLRSTPGDFLRQRRIDFAVTQLLDARAPLIEIALQTGFCDQSHFCRVFKSLIGMTPTAYQKLFSRRP
jgi:AraC family transcriptional regulator